MQHLSQILNDRRVPFYEDGGHRHARHGWIQMDCPFCGKHSSKFHLGYCKSNGYFSCWSCGGLRPAETISELLDINLSDAIELAKSLKTKTFKSITSVGVLKVPKGIRPLMAPHKRYLKRRGFNLNTIENLWQVRSIGVSAKLAWRLFIPIKYKGKLVSWTTRSIVDHGVRYISAGANEELLPHKTLLYGEDLCLDSIVICEGPTDVWAGGVGFVATFGLGFSRAQILKMSKFTVRVIWFDPEPKAQARAVKLADALDAFAGETYVITSNSDPGSASVDEIKKVRKIANL